MSFFQSNLGEIAALGAVACWVPATFAFAAGSRRLGATRGNVLMLIVAFLVFLPIHAIVVGTWWPVVDSGSFWYLVTSGVLALGLGNQVGFIALADVGPRVTTLLETLAPPITVAVAWFVLNEHLSLIEIVATVLTLAGIMWVVLESPGEGRSRFHESPHRVRGLLCAAAGAILHGGGIILTKLGMGHERLPDELHVDTASATLIRMAAASSSMILLGMLTRRWRKARPTPPREAGRWQTGVALVIAGAVLGPAVGVWLSMTAIDRAPAGIAVTLMSMMPVAILPFVVIFEKERLSWRAILGAILAVAGVVLLIQAG